MIRHRLLHGLSLLALNVALVDCELVSGIDDLELVAASTSGSTGGSGGHGPTTGASRVPGGDFRRSNDASHPATVSAFDLDVYEITVGRFRAFVESGPATAETHPESGQGASPRIPGSGWNSDWNALLAADATSLRAALACGDLATWTESPGASEDKPIHCITWYEAFAFCAWDGGRLPTETEWNFAAAGGGEQRAFPWSKPAESTTIDATFAVYGCTAGASDAAGCTADDVARVGTRPKGAAKWGHLDMAGGAAEWTLDSYRAELSASCVDCADIDPSASRVFRGGGFADTETFLRSDMRAQADPASRGVGVGARCARDVAE